MAVSNTLRKVAASLAIIGIASLLWPLLVLDTLCIGTTWTAAAMERLSVAVYLSRPIQAMFRWLDHLAESLKQWSAK